MIKALIMQRTDEMTPLSRGAFSYVRGNKMLALSPLLLWILCLCLQDLNRPYVLVACSLVWAILTASAVVCLKDIPRSGKWNSEKGVIVIAALFFGTLLLSCQQSPSSFFSLNELATAALAPIFVLTFVLLRKRGPDKRAKGSSMLLLVSTLAIAGLAIVQALTTHVRPTGIFADTNVLSAFLNVALLSLLIEFTSHRKTAGWRWVALVLLSLAHAATASRGGDLALSCALLLIGLATLSSRLSLRPLFYGIAIMISAHTAAACLPFELRSSNTIALLLTPGQVIESERSATSRIAIWNSTLEAYKHTDSFFGTGLGTFSLVYPRYRSTGDLTTSGARAHSDYLERLLEGGPLLCFAAFVFGLVLPAYLYIRAYASRTTKTALGSDPMAFERMCAAAIAIALGLHGAINFILAVPALGYLFAMQIPRALPKTAAEAPKASSASISLGKVAIAFAGVSMTATLLLLALGAWLIDTAGSGFKRDHTAAWIQLANLGTTLQPFDPRFREALAGGLIQATSRTGHGAQRTFFAVAAHDEIARWIASNPCDTHALEALGQLARLEPTVAGNSPLAIYQSAVDCNPQSLGLRVELAREMEALDQPTQAYAVLAGGLKWASTARDGKGFDNWLESGMRLADRYGTSSEQQEWLDWQKHIVEYREARRSS